MAALKGLFEPPRNGTIVPQRVDATPLEKILWAQRELPAEFARQSHYRISGITGSGKSHLTKLFLLDALREVERNDAKLVVFEPKREFYAWIQSVRREYNYTFPVTYFMPSDKRGATLEFWRDYPSDQDSRTLANAFFPSDPNEREQFWSKSLRTIFAQVFDAIKWQLGYADLRLACLVLEDEDLTRASSRPTRISCKRGCSSGKSTKRRAHQNSKRYGNDRSLSDCRDEGSRRPPGHRPKRGSVVLA